MSGTHVQATLLIDADNPDNTAIRVMIWPLPNDPKLHEKISNACRDAVNVVLVKAGIGSGEIKDVSDKSGRTH